MLKTLDSLFTDFSDLDEDAQRLLCAYAYYYMGNHVGITEIDQKLCSIFSSFSVDIALKELLDKEMMEKNGYVWSYRSYVFSLKKNIFIPALLYTLIKRRDLVLAFKDNGLNRIKSNALLRNAIGELVDSDFEKCPSAANISAVDPEFLIPIIDYKPAAILFKSLQRQIIQEVVNVAICSYIEKDEVRYISCLEKIVEGNANLNVFDKNGLKNYFCLYEYIAFGSLGECEKVSTDYWMPVLYALVHLKNKNYDLSVKFFADALKRVNKNQSTKNLFYDYLINCYLVMAYMLEGSEASLNKLRILRNKLDAEPARELIPSRFLIDILNNKDMKTVRSEMTHILKVKEFKEDYHGFYALFVLLAKYIGLDNLPELKKVEMPNLALLRHELSPYLNLTEADKELLNFRFGETPILTSIKIRSEWENAMMQLNRLLGNGTAAGPDDSNTVNARCMFLMQRIDSSYVELREQSRLKNGQWGSGKFLSMSRFLSGQFEGVTDGDRRISERCRRHGEYYNPYIYDVIEEMVPESRLYVGTYAPFDLVDVKEDKPYIVITKTDAGFEISSNVSVEDCDREIIVKRTGRTSLSFTKLPSDIKGLYSTLLQLGTFPPESEEQLRALLPKLGVKVEIHSDLIEGGSTLKTIDGNAQACMRVTPEKSGTYSINIIAKPVASSNEALKLGSGEARYIGEENGQRVWVNRDIKTEKKNKKQIDKALDDILNDVYEEECVSDVKKDLFKSDSDSEYDPDVLLPLMEFAQQNPDIIYTEWKDGSKLRIRQTGKKSGWNASIKQSGSWFEIEGEVKLDENTILSMAQLLDLVNANKGRYIKLSDDEYIALSKSLHRQLLALNSIATRDRSKMRISPFSAALLGDDDLNGDMTLVIDDNVKKMRKRIIDSSNYSPDIPADLKAELRPYQKEGYQWMARLNSWGAGALLADDMGLGKTVQSIAFFLLKANEGPTLVVAPASVAPNWLSELEKFAPSLHGVFLNAAEDRTEAIRSVGKGDVLVTTYGLLLSVNDDITTKDWNVVCLDEAHIIKNRGAKTSAVAMNLKAENKIMLTGTPIQNHLGELWNLFQFLNPGLLGSYNDFQRRFIIPIQNDNDKLRQEMLDRLVHPFMLRRTKDSVLKDLPEKTEVYQKVELSKEEMAVYEIIRMKAEAMLEEKGDGPVDVNTLAEITRLRQASCSASLVEKKWKGESSKVTALTELLSDVIEGGNRALVFSQFTSFLEIVRNKLTEQKIPFFYLDGSTPVAQRTKLVNKFQKGDCPVFIISLKAGGLGLNLTGANYVFHLDPWWNPAIEQQATDRAHRIGQKQAVTVYHLISQNTIEEKIIRLHDKKRTLANNVLDGTDISHKLTGKDLLEMVTK